ncbi:MAG: hypothetical protein JWO98_2162 [Frankiales bacterium]|nr:hypothetical protein [Frankiales bacterium]
MRLCARVAKPSHRYHRRGYGRNRTRCEVATSQEILAYLNEVVDDYQLEPYIRFGTDVVSVHWDDALQGYRLRTSAGDEHEFEIVVSAVGCERLFTPEERKKYESRLARRLRRWRLWLGVLRLYVGKEFHHIGSAKNVKREASARAFIDDVFADRPDLRTAVTPTYPYAGKRQMFNDTFYASLLHDNVELVAKPVERVTAHGIVDADGIERPVDVIVMATGYKASSYLSTLQVVGPGGRDLHTSWGDSPTAFLGVVVPGFPNFYMIYGPNANGAGSYLFVAEREAEYVVRNIRWMMRSHLSAIDVRSAPVERYNRWLQSRMRGTSWIDGGTRNYYTAPSGIVVTNYPEGPISWALFTRARRLLSVPYKRYPALAASSSTSAQFVDVAARTGNSGNEGGGEQ